MNQFLLTPCLSGIWIISEDIKIKRPLLFFAEGFVLGEVLFLLGVVRHAGILAAALTGIFSVLRLIQKRKTGRGKEGEPQPVFFWLCLGIGFLFVLVGFCRIQRAQQWAESELSLNLDKRTVVLEGTIEEIQVTAARTALVLQLCQIQSDDGLKELEQVQVYLDGQQQILRLGNRVQVTGQLTAFSQARNPGEFDFRNYYRAQNINYRLWGKSCVLVDGSYYWYRDCLYRFAEWGMKMLHQVVKDEVDVGIYQAAILGNRSELDEEIRTLYQRNGIAHLLAISGLHLSLVGMTIYQLFRRCGAGFAGAGILGGIIIISYVIMTGASSSIIRAAIMMFTAFLAAYLGRTYDLLSALGMAGLCLLWENSYLVCQAGFQLSFGAILGLGMLYPLLAKVFLEDEKDGFRKYLKQAVLSSLSVQFMTVPVVLYHYFQLPVYGIFLNLIVIPLMGYVLVSAFAGIILGCVRTAWGTFAVGTGHYILLFYQYLCAGCELLPYSNLVLGRPRFGQILWYYFILYVCCFILRVNHYRNKEQSNQYAKPVRNLLFIIILLSVIILRPLPTRGLQVTFLDVGQGDGICLRTRNQVILIDGGSSDVKNLGTYRLEPFLKSQGIVTVDYSFVTHGDSDHISGLVSLLETGSDIHIRHLVLPVLGLEDEAYHHLIELVEGQGGTVSWMKAGDYVASGKLLMTCLYPGVGDIAADRNAQSLVLKVDYGDFHMLLTGDMGEEQEQIILRRSEVSAVLSEIQVLKLAHHGSRYSNSAQWLEQISPVWAVVSYGEGNSYGHPHEEVVERLAEEEISLMETARTGAVRLSTNGKKIRWYVFVK